MQTSTSSNIALADGVGHTFFASHAPAREEAVKSGDGDDQACLGQRQAQLIERDVLARLPKSEDVRSSLLDPARPHVTALRLGSELARFAPLRLPADRCRWRNAKPACRSPTA